MHNKFSLSHLEILMLQSVDPRTGNAIGAAWPDSTQAEVEAVVLAAAEAAPAMAATTAVQRATLLQEFAAALEAAREPLVTLADLETALGLPRLNGELDRTCFQLRGFARVLEEGAVHSTLAEPAVADAPPHGRPRMTRVRVPLGPVAMFSASNFPFAFSVLGGDTVSALSAGCPVVVKAHPAHPELSRQTFALAQRVVAAQCLPAGILGYVQGEGFDVGIALVKAPAIAAVAFTGSFRGGTALAKVAAERSRPIPFYGELGSVNPVVVLPEALESKLTEQASLLAGSICLGAGQFCTSPGIIVVPEGALGDVFIQNLTRAMQVARPHAMLTHRMQENFTQGVARWRANPTVEPLTAVAVKGGPEPLPFLGQTNAASFLADPSLREEVFGSAALVVRVVDMDEAAEVLYAVGGSLTVTLWGAETSTIATKRLVLAALHIAGRVLFSGVPTGVAVTAAQQHGGPFPASTAPATTSVGYAALDRFLRPLTLQDAPSWVIS
jgi:NADP-dependent aldehyde dehydrogenase